jgi:hypothetical protein
MNGQIPWWQSRTIWFGLLQTLLAVAVGFGLFTSEQSNQLLGYADQIIAAVMAALAVLQVQGRWTATKEIKTGILPPDSTPPGGKP